MGIYIMGMCITGTLMYVSIDSEGSVISGEGDQRTDGYQTDQGVGR